MIKYEKKTKKILKMKKNTKKYKKIKKTLQIAFTSPW